MRKKLDAKEVGRKRRSLQHYHLEILYAFGSRGQEVAPLRPSKGKTLSDLDMRLNLCLWKVMTSL